MPLISVKYDTDFVPMMLEALASASVGYSNDHRLSGTRVFYKLATYRATNKDFDWILRQCAHHIGKALEE